MKRFRDWMGGAVWGVAVYKLWKRWRRKPAVADVPAADDADARAEELRAKLAESREAEEPPTEPEADEPAGSVEDRRRQVHDEGRAAIDRMNDG